jgi:hypothetical protein
MSGRGRLPRPHGAVTEHLEEAKSHEGIGSAGRLTPASSITDSRTEQGPVGEAGVRGAVGQPAAAEARQRREGTFPPTRWARLCARQNPLEGEPWTWQWGETNPRDRMRSKPSRACETPRAEGGEPGNSPRDVRRFMPRRGRSRTPREAFPRHERGGRLRRRTLERSEAHERMKPLAKAGGGRCAVIPQVRSETTKDVAGAMNPMSRGAARIQHSAGQPTS